MDHPHASLAAPSLWKPKIDLLQSSPINPSCQIEAPNDIAAVWVWLNRYPKKTTFSTYKKEAERFLLWCGFERGLHLKQLKVQDFEAYFKFLQNPPATWMAPKNQSIQGRDDLHWRPFVGPLNKPSLLAAIRIINSLINYLVSADYLKTNPIKLIRKASHFTQESQERKYRVWERMLEDDEWQAVQQILTDLPEDSLVAIDHKLRTQFLFSLLYLLGLRVHEVTQHTWGAFRQLNGQWWFMVRGKGDKLGHIPVNDQLLSMVKIYRLHLNKSPLPLTNEAEHLIVSRKTKKPLGNRQLFGLVKEIGKMAANTFKDQSDKAKKLESLSPHWLRHLSASHQDKAGISGTMIQANHRHGSFATTQIYLHTEDSRRFSEMQKVRMDIEPKMIIRKKENAKIEMKISLIGGPLSEELGLERFIYAVENHILNDAPWSRKETLPNLIQHYRKIKVFKDPLEIVYWLDGDIDQDRQVYMRRSIVREAEIRLFECRLALIPYSV